MYKCFAPVYFLTCTLFEDHRTDWKLFRFAKCIVFNFLWPLTIVLTLLTLIFFCLTGLPGDISALMSLGAFYSRGTGVKQDYEKSFKCYKAAADQGITQDLRLLIS